MPRRIQYALLLVGLLAMIVRPGRAEITAEQVREAIARGVAYLQKQQNKATGGWTEYNAQPGGLTALCTLALLNSGVPPSDPSIQRALAYLRELGNPKMTYSTALQTMVFCAAEPDRDRLLIRRNVQWLERVQIPFGDRKGAWRYSDRLGSGDNSNTQFALLALHEAERAGVEVNPRTWRLALAYWKGCQNFDGSWRYVPGQPASGSMTCAGISSVIIASGQLHEGGAQVVGGRVQCCGAPEKDDSIERALQWLGRHFTVHGNPLALADADQTTRRVWRLYYLYGVERVGRLTGRRFIGRHDWYREGAESLVAGQDKLSGFWKGVGHGEGDPLIGTSLALLFLSKGRRPVVAARLKYGEEGDDNWNLHRGALQRLTSRVEWYWNRDLTWQTIDLKAATVEDLLEAPVLLLSGKEAVNLTPQQKENLRRYVEAGGFLLADASCGGRAFDRSFRRLMKELFPESPMRLLPPTHPVWYAEERVDPEFMRPLYGVNACCRTSVVYCPEDLSCYWELSRGTRQSPYPPKIQKEVDACLTIGANILAYATNRELKEKLERPQWLQGDRDQTPPPRGVLEIPTLAHGGGADDAPNALPNLLQLLQREILPRASTRSLLLSPDDPAIDRHPLIFLHGRRDFRFTPAQRKNLAAYLDRGGFLFADAICSSPAFAAALRRELAAMFPDRPLTRIPPSHPLFTTKYQGYDLARVTLRDPQTRGEGERLEAKLVRTTPLLEGLEIDGRIAVVFSPYDISCALENVASPECKGYDKQDAAKIGVNVILFALQQ